MEYRYHCRSYDVLAFVGDLQRRKMVFKICGMRYVVCGMHRWPFVIPRSGRKVRIRHGLIILRMALEGSQSSLDHN